MSRWLESRVMHQLEGIKFHLQDLGLNSQVPLMSHGSHSQVINHTRGLPTCLHLEYFHPIFYNFIQNLFSCIINTRTYHTKKIPKFLHNLIILRIKSTLKTWYIILQNRFCNNIGKMIFEVNKI